MRRFLSSVIVILITCIIFFVTGEVFFRIFRGAPNPLASTIQVDPAFLFKPNSVSQTTSPREEEPQYTAHINKYGYRGKDFSVPKKKGVIRIFAVGDSFTYGVGSEDNTTIPYLIQEKLRAKNINAEVINAGIGGSSTIAHYVNLRDLHLNYEPDLVLLFFDLTDLWDDWNLERHAIYNKQGEVASFDFGVINGKRSWLITVSNYSAFCRYFYKKILPSIKKMRALGFMEYSKLAIQGKRAKSAIVNKNNVDPNEAIKYDGLLMMRGRDKKDLIDKHWVRTEKYLTKIKQLLDKRNIPLVIVMYPHGIYVSGDQWSEGREAWGFEAGKLYTDHYPFEIVESYAKKKGLAFINTLDNFLKAQKKPFFFKRDGHLTPQGNEIVAESIASSGVFKNNLKSQVSD